MVAALIGGHCQLLPVMAAVALVFLLCVLVRRSHRSEVATFADGRTVRRLGDGGRLVFLLRPSIDTAVMVAALIGGRCQLLPVMVAVALVFLLCVLVRRSHRSEVATIADGRRVRPAPCRWVRFVIGAPRLSAAPAFAGVVVIVAVALVFLLCVLVRRFHRSPFLLRVAGCALSIDTAVMVAALIGRTVATTYIYISFQRQISC